jgi:hypothetical protein
MKDPFKELLNMSIKLNFSAQNGIQTNIGQDLLRLRTQAAANGLVILPSVEEALKNIKGEK